VDISFGLHCTRYPSRDRIAVDVRWLQSLGQEDTRLMIWLWLQSKRRYNLDEVWFHTMLARVLFFVHNLVFLSVPSDVYNNKFSFVTHSYPISVYKYSCL
jgi:hypothetical protein